MVEPLVVVGYALVTFIFTVAVVLALLGIGWLIHFCRKRSKLRKDDSEEIHLEDIIIEPAVDGENSNEVNEDESKPDDIEDVIVEAAVGWSNSSEVNIYESGEDCVEDIIVEVPVGGGNSNEFNKEECEEDNIQDVIIEPAVGGGNLNEANREIDTTGRALDWADEDTIKALVSELPRNLKNPQNTCLSKSEKKSKLDSCAVDSARSVVEAILLNQGGTKFSGSENFKAREVIEAVKLILAWRLQNEYKFREKDRERFWDILMKHFPESFKPKGNINAAIKPVMDALVQGQPLEVIFTASCLNAKCKQEIGTLRYKFEDAPCAYSLNIFQGRISNLDERLPEIVQKSLKRISMKEAKRIRCLQCKTFGAKISPIEPSHLKIPNVLIIEFNEGEGNQEMYPMRLSEEISFKGGEIIYRLVSVVMKEAGHIYIISRIGENWYNFDDIKKDPAKPFQSSFSAFMMEDHEKGRQYIFNNEKEALGCAVLYVVYTSVNEFIGDYFQENIEAQSFSTIICDDGSIDEFEEDFEGPDLSTVIDPEVLEISSQHQDDQRGSSYDNASTPKKRMLGRYIASTSKTRNPLPDLNETPQHLSELLTTYKRKKTEGVTVVPYGPEHFRFILEAVNRNVEPSIVHFKGNLEMKEMYSRDFSDFDQNKNLGEWAEQRKHFTLGNHIGIQVLAYKNRKVTLKDVLKPHRSDEFTTLSLLPWFKLGEQPSPFDESFYDPSSSILTNKENFGKVFGITEPTTEVSPAGSMLPMHLKEHHAQAINFNHGPGVKLWVVIESKFTLKAGEILEKHKFKSFYGACCWTFCHRDVVFNLERDNIPYQEILQHPGDTVFLPPGVLHMVTNITANMSESLNIILKKDLSMCRSYKVCQTHKESVHISGREEMENLFEKFKMNRIENFIYFADDQRDRKLRALRQLKNSGNLAKEALLKDLEQLFMVSHEVPEILKAFEDGSLLFEDDITGIGSASNHETGDARQPENHSQYPNIAHDLGTDQGIRQPENQLLPTQSPQQRLYPDISQYLEESQPEIEPWTQNADPSPIPISEISYDPTEMDTHSSTSWQNVEQNETDLVPPPEHSEPVAENVTRGGDDEGDFIQIIDGQNILKSRTTFKFKCLCPCQPPIVSEHFIKCYKHLREHQMEIIIPSERCSDCGGENKSVFKMIHTCALKPYSRKKMRWRSSGNHK